MPQSLLAFDTDRIKSYVFATDKLKEIRGASAILDELNREAMVDVVKNLSGQTIYANGGSGLFIIDSNRVEEARVAVEKLYQERTGTASITGVCVELPPDYKAGDNIQTEFRTLGYRLRAAKDSKAGPSELVTHPYLYFCDSCGTEYAAQKYIETGETALLCADCATKRERDEDVKTSIHRIVKTTIEEQSVAERDLWAKLIPNLAQQGYEIEGHGRPEDFNDLADMSHPSNYIGLIYADGDSMGKELERLKTEDEFREFSKTVDSSVYEAVVAAIVKHLPSQDKTWPFDILLLGGDDLVMVTPADKVLEVGLTVMEKFSELTQKKLSKSLNLSVGIAIAHANYPFGQLRRLAESALKFAKKEGAKRRQAGQEWEGGLLNFVVVSSANHLEFGEYYKADLTAYTDTGYEASEKPKNLFRTLRPYNASEFRKLLGYIQNSPLSNAPRSKLQRLRDIVFQTKKQAMVDGFTTLFHWPSQKQRETVQEVVAEFARLKQSQQNEQVHPLLFPWYQIGPKDDPDVYTPLLDMVEIFDFISTPNQEEENE